MSEPVTEHLTTQIVASIRRMTDEQLGQLIRSQCADEVALRAECDAAKAKRVPNPEAMSEDQLRQFERELEWINGYVWLKRIGKTADENRYYNFLPPWAKFRGE